VHRPTGDLAFVKVLLSHGEHPLSLIFNSLISNHISDWLKTAQGNLAGSTKPPTAL
jgi:hypothetical protein